MRVITRVQLSIKMTKKFSKLPEHRTSVPSDVLIRLFRLGLSVRSVTQQLQQQGYKVSKSTVQNLKAELARQAGSDACYRPKTRASRCSSDTDFPTPSSACKHTQMATFSALRAIVFCNAKYCRMCLPISRLMTARKLPLLQADSGNVYTHAQVSQVRQSLQLQ